MSIAIPCLAKLAVMQRSKLPKMPLARVKLGRSKNRSAQSGAEILLKHVLDAFGLRQEFLLQACTNLNKTAETTTFSISGSR